MPFRPISTDNFRPIQQDNFRPTTSPANDSERGFLGKIGESFERGQEGWHADLAVYEALQENGDTQGALNARKQMAQGNMLDPIDSNMVTDLVYSSAKTAGQMWETLKRSFSGGVKGAAAGAGVAAVAGVAGPQAFIPEELATVPAGAAVGFKLGSAEAAGIMSYRVGVGGMYADMIDQGVSHETAKRVAEIGGIPYALLEALQLKAASPAIKKSLQEVSKVATRTATKKVLAKAGKTYATTLGTEIAEELGQEIVQIASEDIAHKIDKMGIPIDKGYFVDRAKRLGEVAVQSAKAMALIPGPKMGIEAAIQLQNVKAGQEIQDIKSDAAKTSQIKMEDITDPVMATRAAIRDSIRMTGRLDPLRAKQRARQAAEISEIREQGGDDWVRDVRRVQKETLAEHDLEPLSEKVPIEVYQSLDRQIKHSTKLTAFEAPNLSEAMEKLFKEGRRLRPYEVKLTEKIWGQEFAAELQEWSEIEEGKDTRLEDYLNLPRTTSASMDLSRSFRQNILLIGKPKLFAKSIANDYKFLLQDEKAARLYEHQTFIKHGEMIQRMGLRWNDWGAKAGHARGTEQFSSRVAGRIPGVRRSERAFALGGNIARLELAAQLDEQYQGKGLSEKQWQDIGKVVNILTGEGNTKTFGKYGPFLNAAFFAPRLLEARVRSITDLVNPKMDGVARKVLASHMAKFIGINTAVLASMSAVPGVSVERDPRSTDFGKIRIGDTRIDFWGGYLPLARTIQRLTSGKRKTQSGRIVDAEAIDTIASFFQAKLGPIGGAALDNLRGTDFIGDDVSLDADGMLKQFWQRFVPFFMQDVADAVRHEGWKGMATAPLAFHGVGVQTYRMSPGAEVMMRKNEIASQVMNKNWDQLGPEVQKYLEESYPELGEAERRADVQASNFSWLESMAKERKRTDDKIMGQLPKDVQTAIKDLGITTGGVSRNIANGWFLNEKRYREYQDETSKLFNKILPKIVRSPKWNTIPAALRREVIEDVTNKIKNAIRQDIVARANATDLEQL